MVIVRCPMNYPGRNARPADPAQHSPALTQALRHRRASCSTARRERGNCSDSQESGPDNHGCKANHRGNGSIRDVESRRILSAVYTPDGEGDGRQVSLADRFYERDEFLAHLAFDAVSSRARAPYATTSSIVMPIGKTTPVSGPGQEAPMMIPIPVAARPSAASHFQYGAYSVLVGTRFAGSLSMSFRTRDSFR